MRRFLIVLASAAVLVLPMAAQAASKTQVLDKHWTLVTTQDSDGSVQTCSVVTYNADNIALSISFTVQGKTLFMVLAKDGWRLPPDRTFPVVLMLDNGQSWAEEVEVVDDITAVIKPQGGQAFYENFKFGKASTLAVQTEGTRLDFPLWDVAGATTALRGCVKGNER